MQLIIDNRESIKNNFSKSLNIKFENLDIGDYLIKDEEKEYLIIERKTLSDLASSIRDGRFREQKKRLLQNYNIQSILYLIEGNLKDNISNNYTNINNNTLVSCIINTILRDKINLFHTNDSNESIFIIESIFKKYKEQKLTFLDTKTEYQDDFFNSYKKKNKNITKELCFKLMLSCIPDVSVKTSERIILNFTSLQNFIETLNQISDEKKIEYIQNLPSIEKVHKKLSKKVSENIIKFLL